MAQGLTTKQLTFVAAYVGEARGNATKAARLAGYAKPGQEGHRLLKNADIQAAVAAWRDEIKQSAITTVEYRIARLTELEQRLWGIVDAREAAYADTDVIGGETGIVVRDYKSVGTGPDAQLVEVYTADTALAKAIQGVYDDVATELGQRADKVDVTGSFTRRVIVELPMDEGAA